MNKMLLLVIYGGKGKYNWKKKLNQNDCNWFCSYIKVINWHNYTILCDNGKFISQLQLSDIPLWKFTKLQINCNQLTLSSLTGVKKTFLLLDLFIIPVDNHSVDSSNY